MRGQHRHTSTAVGWAIHHQAAELPLLAGPSSWAAPRLFRRERLEMWPFLADTGADGSAAAAAAAVSDPDAATISATSSANVSKRLQ
jgi:hypothetical protein